MQTQSHGMIGDATILLARILLVLLFLIFGVAKITGFGGTVSYMAHTGLPLPWLGAIIAILVEVFVSLALLLGIYTRPLALLMAVYTLATAFIGHPYWTMTGMAHFEAEINFFKNISIIGGFLLLSVTGPGRFALSPRRFR